MCWTLEPNKCDISTCQMCWTLEPNKCDILQSVRLSYVSYICDMRNLNLSIVLNPRAQQM
ncbi:hypothetical protein [Neodiprion abietis nucleopolyhedrovirus]|uniref:Uncharacterized protein n=1 Tax=Neodiprion abietis nucleopolyhedrovirus TaxID=204507 RepID=Q0ZP77_9CBAC|nr:hypothetical protein [Neodiprion abietis nucleopolyhedrovirus]ABC74877.1 unknown [Neodiprion abietis nucleopolyhedrovirus]